MSLLTIGSAAAAALVVARGGVVPLFVPCASGRSALRGAQGQGDGRASLEGEKPSHGGAALVAPAGACGAFAAWALQRRSSRDATRRVCRAAVLTVDAEGRDRFAVEGDAPAAPAAAEGEPGAILPLVVDGMDRWDPLGLSADGDVAKFNRYRSAEIKHGRVCMLAAVGLVVQHYVHIKNFVTPDEMVDMSGIPNGFAALTVFPSNVGFGILVLLAGILELSQSDEGREPGDFGDPLGLQEKFSYVGISAGKWRSYEIEHGRLAMFGVMGTLAAEYTTGYDAVEQWEHAVEGAGKLYSSTTYWLQ